MKKILEFFNIKKKLTCDSSEFGGGLWVIFVITILSVLYLILKSLLNTIRLIVNPDMRAFYFGPVLHMPIFNFIFLHIYPLISIVFFILILMIFRNRSKQMPKKIQDLFAIFIVFKIISLITFYIFGPSSIYGGLFIPVNLLHAVPIIYALICIEYFNRSSRIKSYYTK